jgi:hypothetical protein
MPSRRHRDTGGCVKTTIELRLLLLLTLLLSSCVTPASLARTRASNEFKCPKEQVLLQERPELSDGTFDVQACGQRARYTCTSRSYQQSCVREPMDEAPTKPSPSP